MCAGLIANLVWSGAIAAIMCIVSRLLVLIWTPNTGTGRPAAWAQERLLLCVRPDGLRQRLDRTERRLLRSRPRSRLSRGTPSGRRDSRVCLNIGKSPKTSLVDVELKRDEDSRYRKSKLKVLLIYKIKAISGVDWIDYVGVQSTVTLHLYKENV
jgi:hypothetical protein